jgi:hypothetical protein
MADNRIGEYTTNGTLWPKQDIRGREYVPGESGGNVASLNATQFVILPINYVDDGTLVALREQYAAPAQAEAVVSEAVEQASSRGKRKGAEVIGEPTDGE